MPAWYSRLSIAVAVLVGALALAAWRTPVTSAGEAPASPDLAAPFPAGQPWLITCGYTSDDDEAKGACGHSGSQWNRYALDFQHVGGPAAAEGQPVLAAAGGRVSRAGWQDGLGWHVLLDHGGGYTTVYGHMLAEPVVEAGQDVAQGDTLGQVGCTGRCTGPHIHFAL